MVAPVEHIVLDIETSLSNQLGAQPLPFPGMDKSGAAVCDFYVRSNCSAAAACPFRHIRGDKTIVCKHWLRGLCKKGDQCEFLHEYDMTKMPECYFYSRFNACHNKECPFLHIDPEAKIKDCPWYDRGFCRHGPNCRHRHMRRILCINYLAGFCPSGQSCEKAHPRLDIFYSTVSKFIFLKDISILKFRGLFKLNALKGSRYLVFKLIFFDFSMYSLFTFPYGIEKNLLFLKLFHI